MRNSAEVEPWTREEIESRASTAGRTDRRITLYFNGIRTSFTASPLTAALLPAGTERGQDQKYIAEAIVGLWTHLLPHLATYEMAIDLSEMVNDLRSYYDTTQSDAIATAIVWWNGKNSTEPTNDL